MIAAGLCMMGGCFAQDSASQTVDTYWPTECVEIPRPPSGAVGIYQMNALAPCPQSLHRVYCKQRVISGQFSLFFAFQGNDAPYNVYGAVGSTAQTQTVGIQLMQIREKVNPYDIIEYTVADGMQGAASLNLWQEVVWDDSTAISSLRIIDSRAGNKEFFVSVGYLGMAFCAVPVRSVLGNTGVFDFEQKTLIEL